MATTNQDEKTIPHVSPHRPQLDPGLKDYRKYTFKWDNLRTFAVVLATRTASGAYAAGTEYWFVDKAILVPQKSIVITPQDMEWTDPMPSVPSNPQEFTSPTSATWQALTGDVTPGTLFYDETHNVYVRIVTSGISPDQTISRLRWYRMSSSQPSASFNPGGTYTSRSSLGTGTAWYAESKSP
jgi:hypothetical protein